MYSLEETIDRESDYQYKIYSVNYQGQLLKLIKSICKEAERGGEQIQDYSP